MELPDPNAETERWLARGHAEAHRAMLKQLPPRARLYKVMAVEHLLKSIEGGYLHFNRVDQYKDFPRADADDGAPLPGDVGGNDAIRFEKRPDFFASDYYASARGRTYACCFAASNTPYIWRNYGSGGVRGKAGLIVDLDKMRARLNATVGSDTSSLIHQGQTCLQIFSINYGLIDYVDRSSHRENTATLPNPIRYTYLKDVAFAAEEEFRISLSALGVGRFRLADGTDLSFPASLQMGFDFRAALADGTIELELSPDVSFPDLVADFAKLGINAVPPEA